MHPQTRGERKTLIGHESLDELELHGSGRFPLPPGETLWKLFTLRNAPIDAVAECSAWLCFRDDNWNDRDFADDEDSPEEILNALRDTLPFQPPLEPFVAPPKTGRNDPCPCGSGKKYKKCCGK